MQIEKTTILLEKINNLHKSLTQDPENISSIEKDLLKDYIKAMYELLLDDTNPVQTKQQASKTIFIREVVEQDTPPESESTAEPPSSSAIREEDAPIAAKPEKKTYKPPRIIQVPDDPQPIEEVASTPPPESPQVRHEAPASQVDDDLAELFEDENDGSDLSAKLANKPIKDLTKAISINEKIFTVNELFGGNMIDFEQTLKSLNTFTSFDKAIMTVMVDKAKEYDWTHKKRIKKARNFIKLVKRRYL